MPAQDLVRPVYDRPIRKHPLRYPLFPAPLFDTYRCRKEAKLLAKAILDMPFIRGMGFACRVRGRRERDKSRGANTGLGYLQPPGPAARPGRCPRLLERSLVKLVQLAGRYSLRAAILGLPGQVEKLCDPVTGFC